MAVFVIGYTLHKAESKRYPEVEDAIAAVFRVADRVKVLDTTWVVRSDTLMCGQIRDKLRPKFTNEDKLVVVEAGRAAAVQNLSSAVTTDLQNLIILSSQ